MNFFYSNLLLLFSEDHHQIKPKQKNSNPAKEHYYLSLLFFIRTLQLVLCVLPRSNPTTKNTNPATKNSNLDHNNTNGKKEKKQRPDTNTDPKFFVFFPNQTQQPRTQIQQPKTQT